MKLLGLSFGRKMENNEVLVKEALMGAEEAGAEVGFIRMADLDIKNCTGCTMCAQSLFMGGTGKCVLKDDLPFVDERFLECDALVLGAPIYVLAPPGLYKTVADRFGPSHCTGFLLKARELQAAQGKDPAKAFDERAFKERVAGFIATGGASSPPWLSLGLPSMNLLTFPLGVKVVDQMLVSLGRQANGHAVMTDELLARAHALGCNVAQETGKRQTEAAWHGDEPGTCPVCHSNLLTVTDRNPVVCAVCGISGTLRMDGDRITVTFSEAEQKRAFPTIAGHIEHWDELMVNQPKIMQMDMNEVARRKRKYEGYKELRVK
jgi:multimeric flavodoxin WrbA